MEEESTSPVDRGLLVHLGPADLRRVLPPYLAGFVDDGHASARNLARVSQIVERWSDEACGSILAELREVGTEHRVYPANGFGRELSRAWTEDIVLEPKLEGVEHLRQALAQGPAFLLCNHLSYFDTSATDAVLAWTGHTDLADKLVAVAGPKVYQDLFRLLAASCLNTLPVPQSTTFSHTEKLPARELARRATASLDAAAEAIRQGYIPLLYPEGSRSRTGRLGSFLRGTHRYLSCVEDLRVVPTAITGTEHVMRVGHPKLIPGPVSLTFGPALHVGPDGHPRDVLALAHERVASLLPEHLKPLPGTPATA